jgi:hypothetical protein
MKQRQKRKEIQKKLYIYVLMNKFTNNLKSRFKKISQLIHDEIITSKARIHQQYADEQKNKKVQQ